MNTSKTDKKNLPFESQEFTLCESGKAWHFVKPSAPEKLLDLLTEKQFEKDRFLPYWAELWPATEVLFSYIIKKKIPNHLRICDLGCGLGTITASLTSLGHTIIGVDISPEACIFTRHNTLHNAPVARTACIDWRYPPFKKPFDVILAADILYEPQCLEPVLSFLASSLSVQAQAFIADPCRAPWSTFKQRVQDCGFTTHIAHHALVNNGKTTVEILHITK